MVCEFFYIESEEIRVSALENSTIGSHVFGSCSPVYLHTTLSAERFCSEEFVSRQLLCLWEQIVSVHRITAGSERNGLSDLPPQRTSS